ncbi:MAG TPA: hypothetical protein VMB50_00320, partial [Myxococcales bacterium]|nr:hypothetical protein [Myxococcales bacterium]
MQLRWAVPAGTAALALSALAALAGALAIEGNRHRVPPAPGTGLVRAEIKSVAVAGGSPPIGVIVLAPAAIPLVVPLFVTAGEASIVGERHAADGHARLPAAALASLGAKLTGVVLDGTENPTARAELSTPEGPRSIDASVGEALEWAAAAGAAI